MERWFLFATYSKQSLYGFGTEDEASRYVDILNRGREFNLYGFRELDADELSDLEAGLEAEGFNLGEVLENDGEDNPSPL